MEFRTPLSDLLDVRHPILLAPMGGVSGDALAAAVSRAGGLGLLGPGYDDEAWIEREFTAADGVPVGIGFIPWHLAQHADRLRAALAHGRDWPARFTGRALQNQLSDRWHGREAELQAHLAQERERYATADQVGDVSRAVVWASEAIDLIRDLPPAAELVERMVSEAGAALERGLALQCDADR